MRSYALAIALAMLLSAIYVFQNTAEIAVRFLIFEWMFPQGVWEVLLFGAGAVLMWVFSLIAVLEVRSKYRAQIKERDKKITSLEEERNSFLTAMQRFGDNATPAPRETYADAAEEKEEKSAASAKTSAHEETTVL